jgi:hypothetical protein
VHYLFHYNKQLTGLSAQIEGAKEGAREQEEEEES